jgi:hypothetical protein
MIESFTVSKAWYLAQILPLPDSAAARLRGTMGDFLGIASRLEQLAHSSSTVKAASASPLTQLSLRFADQA